MNDRFVLLEEVSNALKDGRGIVAIESSIATHGLPHPEGMETIVALQDLIREADAVPATIAVLDGRVHVGLSLEGLEKLASARDVSKVSLATMGAVVASGAPGATTVASTMFAARCAGIRVLTAGGIGGVHRGFIETGDVSADVSALSRLPVAVVCSGAKAILDLPRTRELLETLGVPVLAWETSEFPAYYRRSSGLPADKRYDAMDDLARAVLVHLDLGINTGLIVANPIPLEHEIPAHLYDEALNSSLKAAERKNVRGSELTPFLLKRMKAATAGESVRANLQLLRANARVAGRLASSLSRQSGRQSR